MKPFLLLATRAEDAAADNEYQAFLTFSRLAEHQLRRVRLEQRPLGEFDLGDWSGIFLGGGPFNCTDPEHAKSPVQRRVETELDALVGQVVAADFPFLGACYGIGTLGRHQGAVIDRNYAEPVGAVPITLTPQGRQDPLLVGLPDTFQAFVGHKEAISLLPPHAVLLASSPGCPVQAFRVGRNVYATQFHPELDVPGLCTRIEVYKHAGYFEPHQAQDLMAAAHRSDVQHPPAVLRQFVARYGCARDQGPGTRDRSAAKTCTAAGTCARARFRPACRAESLRPPRVGATQPETLTGALIGPGTDPEAGGTDPAVRVRWRRPDGH